MKRKDFHWKVHALGTCPDGGRWPGSEVHYETWSWAGGRGRRRGPWVTGRVMHTGAEWSLKGQSFR